MTAITAVTSQNTTGVNSVIAIQPKEIEKQILFTSKDKSINYNLKIICFGQKFYQNIDNLNYYSLISLIRLKNYYVF